MFAACTVLLDFSFVFCLLSIVMHFSRLARKLPKQVRTAICVIGMYQMRELLYQGMSIRRSLNFRQRRVYSMYHFSFFDCFALEIISCFLVRTNVVGSTEINIF